MAKLKEAECKAATVAFFDKSVLFREELGLDGGATFADLVALVDYGKFHDLVGIEVKSEADNLKLLPAQIPLYDAVFRYCYLSVHEHHLDPALELLPEHWGVLVLGSATAPSGAKVTSKFRPPQPNPYRSVPAMLRLLWGAELAVTARALGYPLASTVEESRKRAAAKLNLGSTAALVGYFLRHRPSTVNGFGVPPDVVETKARERLGLLY